MTQPWLTHDQELASIWDQLTSTYQMINSTTRDSERVYLQHLSEMLRIEYRHLTSTYTDTLFVDY